MNDNALNCLQIDLTTLLSTLIGTLFGGLIVWYLTYLSQEGKVYIFVRKRFFKFKAPSEDKKSMVEVTDLSRTNLESTIWMAIDFYNSSSYNKIARNIQFKIVYEN